MTAAAMPVNTYCEPSVMLPFWKVSVSMTPDERSAERRANEEDDLDACDRHAGEPRGLRVAAGGIDPVAEGGALHDVGGDRPMSTIQ